MNIKTIYFCTMLFDSVAVCVAFLGVSDGNLLKHFEERGFLTSIFVFQLLMISLLSLMVFWILNNREKNEGFSWQNSSILWVIIGFGFLFLAIDERYKIHEKIDYRIHDIFSIQETGIN